jgi:cysteine-rich repeat protein
MKHTRFSFLRPLASLGACVVVLAILASAVPADVFAQTDAFGTAQIGDTLVIQEQSIWTTVGNIINVALSLLGIVAVGIVLFAGFTWMTANGDSGKIDRAKAMLRNGIIGLAIIFSSWAITTFLLSTLGDATGISNGEENEEEIVDERCSNPVFYAQNPLLCTPPGFQTCEEQHFVVTSITPNTFATNMNDVAVRVLFSQPLADGQQPEEIVSITAPDGVAFVYEFLPGKRGVEAKATGPTCGDNETCLLNGNYNVTIAETVESAQGETLEEQVDCGEYETSARFVVNTTDVVDVRPPTIQSITLNGAEGNTAIVHRRGELDIAVQAIDAVSIEGAQDGGIGYAEILLRDAVQVNTVLRQRLVGPAIADGSSGQVELLDTLYIPSSFDAPSRYVLTVRVHDHNGNVQERDLDVVVVGERCDDQGFPQDNAYADQCLGEEGASCSADWQCVSQLCDEQAGRCIDAPIISQLDPWAAAPGSPVTLVGNYFGNDTGRVQFGIETTNDGVLSADDIWIDAVAPTCEETADLWNDQYVVTSVPRTYTSRSYTFSKETHSNFVEIPHHPQYESLDGFSAELWVRMSDLSERMPILRKEGSFLLSYYQDGIILGRIWQQDGTQINTGGDIAIEPNTWNHVMLVADPDTAQVRLYINGAQSAAAAYDGAPIGGTTDPVFLGARTRTQDFFSGDVDDVRWYNRAFTAAEVKEHSLGQMTSDGLLAHFALDESTGTKVYDHSATQNHGTHYQNTEVVREVVNPTELIGQANRPAEVGYGTLLAARIERADNPELFDISNDDRGPKRGPYQGKFFVNTTEIPLLCEIVSAETGATAGEAGSAVVATGDRFGETESEAAIQFGEIPGVIRTFQTKQIEALLPTTIRPGRVGVRIERNGVLSNALPFTVLEQTNTARPAITNIAPSSVTPGSYITVQGTGFGNQTGIVYAGSSEAHVRDCADTNNQPNGYEPCELLPVTDLPGCTDLDTWSNTEIVVGIPSDLLAGTYALLVKNTEHGLTTAGNDRIVVEAGDPMPSICAIVPARGPAPLPENAAPLELRGINFGSEPTVFFWQRTANAEDLTTWLRSDSSVTPEGNSPILATTNETIETRLPVNESGTSMATGPIVIQAGNALSNPIQYEVLDCRDGGTGPGAGYQCCQEGPEAGQWKPEEFVCAGETRVGGYVWRFTTGQIPDVPRVVEYCDVDGWNDDGAIIDLPSPSPWQQWSDASCVNSQISIRFTHAMDQDSLRSGVRVLACETDQEGEADCDNATELTFGQDVQIPNQLPPQALIIEPTGDNGAFAPNTWYRVMLANTVTSAEQALVLGQQVVRNVPLQQTKPCGDGTAYCFDFLTGDQTCTIAHAGISPAEYRTRSLGQLFDPRNIERPLYYLVWGRANESCIAISADDYAWTWQPLQGTDTRAYVAPELASSRATATALQHTAPDAVEIETATTITQTSPTGPTEQQITGRALLTIDLEDPKVTSVWPNCEASCANAVLGVAFNRPMAPETYPGSLTIAACATESCDDEGLGSPIPVVGVIDQDPNQYVVRPESPLEPNTWYKATITGQVRAVEQYEPVRLLGTALEQYTWKFRTKADGALCTADVVRVDPYAVEANTIGEKTIYQALPYGAPDACSPYGQQLDPWQYGWEWSSADTSVATISTFETQGTIQASCGVDCTPRGSQIPRQLADRAYVCGNGIVDPGEDCDIAAPGEVPGTSCSFSCLRPGSTATCGNGIIEPEQGEECDPDDPDTGAYCDPNSCLRLGSSQNPPQGNVNTPWCGSGQVTVGEDCDIALFDADPANFNGIGCSASCLHEGTVIADAWCTDSNLAAYPAAGEACAAARSVCGNGIVERAETCEIVGVDSIVLADGTILDGQEKAATYCSNTCELQNLCALPGAEQSDAYCAPGTEGCTNDCTLAGASLQYATPSLCGDGIVGTGEYPICEDIVQRAPSILGQNPLQIATAIGEGDFDPNTKIQETTISARVVSTRGTTGAVQPLTNERTGQGEYALQCGYERLDTPVLRGNQLAYNTCLDLEEGVAFNSCCYERPTIVESYPERYDGIDGAGVCRNTYLSVTFSGEIDLRTVRGNIMIARGYEDFVDCAALGERNVTAELIGQAGLITAAPQQTEQGLLARAWQSMRRAIASLFGAEETVASPYILRDLATTWCSGRVQLAGDPMASFEENEDGEIIATTLELQLAQLLEPSALYTIQFTGGTNGIRDTRGVSIMNGAREDADPILLSDTITFKTSENICKIASVSVEPAQALFVAPNTSTTFRAIVESTNQARIAPIPNVYDWEYAWKPTETNAFAIPFEGYSATEATTALGSTQVEGTLTAIGQVEVTADQDTEDNHVGKLFSGTTELRSNFCERPWPPRAFFPYEDGNPPGRNQNNDGYNNQTNQFTGEPVEPSLFGGYFNFSIDYCADAGRSGVITDDLPFLEPNVIAGDFVSTVSQCVSGPNTGAQCASTFDCYTSTCSNAPDRSCGSSEDCFEIIDHGVCTEGGVCSGDAATACTTDFDCQPFVSYGTCEIAEQNYDQFACQAIRELPENVLKRWLMFSDQNDDAIGIQIFANPERLSAYAWYQAQSNTRGPIGGSIDRFTLVRVAGYDAITDGNNYFINALNITDFGQIYNNIYHFSLSSGADESTRNVFDQIIDSLEFNINVSNIGYCLAQGSVPSGTDPRLTQLSSLGETVIANVSDVSCRTDLDCLTDAGAPIEGTAGICSNAQTKFLRDWERLQSIERIQETVEDYALQNAGRYPTLAQGTFVPGYTNSRWPSWGALAAQVGGGLPLDEINQWSSCGVCSAPVNGQVTFCSEDADCGQTGGTCQTLDAQTCWDVQAARVVCPAYSSMFEYVYQEQTASYTVHTPLEYFVQSRLEQGGFNIDFSHISSAPWCASEEIYTPVAASCGDGVVNGQTEQCDPAGSRQIGTFGLVSATPGQCAFDYLNQSCGSTADCGVIYLDDGTYIPGDIDTTYCTDTDGRLLYGETSESGEHQVFACTTDTACSARETFGNRLSVTINKGGTIDLDDVDRTTFRCTPVDDLEGYDRGERRALACEGASNEQLGQCLPGEQAVAFCNDQCQFEYGQCTTQFACGNGIVEGIEVCDDGALNGTYGQCNDSCSGLFNNFCGDGEVNVDANGNPLEYCDIANEQAASIGYCAQNVNRAACRTDEDCTIITDGTCEETYPVGQTPGVCPVGYIGATVTDACTNPGSPCFHEADLRGRGASFIVKYGTNTIAADTPSVCTFDGDILYDGGALDETGTLLGFGCQTNDACTRVATYHNRAMNGPNGMVSVMRDLTSSDINYVANSIEFYTDILSADQYTEKLVCTPMTQLDGYVGQNSSSGPVLCPAPTSVCSNDPASSCSTDADCEGIAQADVCLGTDIFTYHRAPEYSCADDCQGPGSYCGDGYVDAAYGETCDDGNASNYDGCSSLCQIETEYSTPASPGTPGQTNICGDGLYFRGVPNDLGGVEACDLGDQNGIPCDPAYEGSCTYCSADCSEVLTIDNRYFCGNGSIESFGGEVCETNQQTGVTIARVCSANQSQTCTEDADCAEGDTCIQVSNLTCDDVGQVSCSDSCLAVVENCAVCGITTDSGATPRLFAINPMLDQSDADAVSLWARQTQVSLVRLDAEDNLMIFPPAWDLDLTAPVRMMYDADPAQGIRGDDYTQGLETVQVSPEDGLRLFDDETIQLQSNALCGEEYALRFNFATPEGEISRRPPFSVDPYAPGDYFDFPVDGEFAQVDRDLIVSPTVPDGVFRVVMKWTNQEEQDGANFVLGVYNSSFEDGGILDTVVAPSAVARRATVVSLDDQRSLRCGQVASGQIVLTFSDLISQGVTSDQEEFRDFCWLAQYQSYWWPIKPAQMDNEFVYVHPENQIKERLFTQAITLDANRDIDKHTFAVFVRNIGEPIADFRRSNLRVEVYTDREGQDRQYSVFAPEKVYPIRAAADTSSNVDAEYWHIFNLEYDQNRGTYEIVPFQDGNRMRASGSLETNFQDLLKNVPRT